MKKTIFFIMIFACAINTIAQENKNILLFEFGYGINSYSMSKLNEFYIDSFASKPNIDLLKNKITSGQNFNFSLKYQPTGLFDFGVFVNYQYGNSKHNSIFTETNDIGLPIKDHIRTYELITQAVGIGLISTLYVSHTLKFHKKENMFLNRFHCGIELNGGIGFSKVSADIRYPSLRFASCYDYFTSTDFYCRIGLKFEYNFIKSAYVSTIGLKGGYQYFRTKIVKDRLGNDWVVLGQHPISLDFSGFFIGKFVKFGK